MRVLRSQRDLFDELELGDVSRRFYFDLSKRRDKDQLQHFGALS
jgi:hypothetical protein